MGFLLRSLRFDQRTPADDDVSSRLVDLQYDTLNRTADVIADVGRTTNVHLRRRQKNVHADVDQKAALDLSRDGARHHVFLVNRFADAVPRLDLLRLTLAEGDHPRVVVLPSFRVLQILDEDLENLTRLRRLFRFIPLVARDDSFALVTDVYQDEIVVDAKDLPLNRLIDGQILARAPVDVLFRLPFQREIQFLFPLIFIKIQSSN